MWKRMFYAGVGVLGAAVVPWGGNAAQASLIAYYNFNDANVSVSSGTATFADTSGFASPSDLSITNYTSAMRTPDPWGGQALTFNGTQTGYVDYPHNVYKLYRMGTDVNFDGTSQGAIEFWYKRDVGSPAGGFAEFYDGQAYNYSDAEVGIFNSGYLPNYIGMNTSDSVTANTNYSPDNTIKFGSWNQVVMTWDGTNQYLYQDGVLLASGPQSGPLLTDRTSPTTVFENFYFATAPGLAGNFVGSIDELSMYNSSLSAADVMQQYQAGLAAMPEPGSLSLLAMSLVFLASRSRVRRSES